MGKDQDLLEAARIGNIAMVGKLLEQISRRHTGPFSSFRRCPSINSQDVNGYTPLHHACLNGHSNIVRLLLAHNAAPDMPDIRGSTPLYLAAWAGRAEIVKQLLMHPQKPANANAQTIDNETPLHCAAQHGHNTVLAILLAYGADPTIRNNSFQTALDLAAQFGRLQAVQTLIRHHPMLLAPYRASGRKTTIAKNESSTSYEISPTTHIFTHTCLHLASRNGHKKVVEALLAAGVDVNIMTHAGSALHEAALCGKKDVVTTLLKAGVDPNARNGNGETALDLLKDYPHHVTYEITSAINDFYKDTVNGTHFRPISGISDTDENGRSDGSVSPELYKSKCEPRAVPKTIYERRKMNEKYGASNAACGETLMPKTMKSNRLSVSLTSLDMSSMPQEHYLLMKPIAWQKSNADLTNRDETLCGFTYSPVYKEPYSTALSGAQHVLGASRKLREFQPARLQYHRYEPRFFMRTESATDMRANSPKRQAPAARYRCVDEYVKMTEPKFTQSSPNISPKKPLPSPRKIFTSDYANINHVTSSKSNINHHQTDDGKSPSPKTIRALALDANNNNKHSPTPDFPPPTVTQAEVTIMEFMRPQSVNSKRRSMRLKAKRHGDLESFIVETLNQLEMEPPASPFGSRTSDCVEEFVGDRPFAGLFKGSTLNLANDDDDVNSGSVVQEPSGLRSPSLVRSVKPIAAKRQMQKTTQRNNCEVEDFNASKVWAEIDTILENIGNEFTHVKSNTEQIIDAPVERSIGKAEIENAPLKESEKIRKINGVEPVLDSISKDEEVSGVSAEAVKIRDPADLLIGTEKNCTPNWCHSPNTLIYGQILYTVYYLGSTVIRELRGTSSTRKSIQKFKRNAKRREEKKLMDLKPQSRLEVSIALSSTGVKFIDVDNQSTICKHHIENIHCVCQDAEDLRYFAYITKENYIHYCHVFMVDNQELTREIILTLGEAFEVAYQLALKNDSTATNIADKVSIDI